MKTENLYKFIVKEWDDIAEDRFSDLVTAKDITYETVLKPSLLKSLRDVDMSSVLDIGCGVGVFTSELSLISKKILGIDISKKSIELSKRESQKKNIAYQCINYLDMDDTLKFSTIIANMTLMTMPDISLMFRKVYNHLIESGHFIFTITHPSFWPLHWSYYTDNFNYNIETEIISNFKIRNKVYDNFKTRHYHRPLNTYFSLIIENGFKLQEFKELEDQIPYRWYPRFLLVKCQK
jgi:2-polyprenyl-3-methyl-5-hydroxy-6-metoxy-1,4-benzoquinol methylase